MKHHLNFAVSLHENRLWNSKYHYGIKQDMKLENSVHGNLSRNNTFPSVTRNWKYYAHETQIKCLVNVSCEYSCKQMNVKENSIFFAVWDFSSDLVSEQVGFTSICAVVKCLVACTRSMWDTKGPKVIVDGQDLEHGQVLTTWLMGVTPPPSDQLLY